MSYEPTLVELKAKLDAVQQAYAKAVEEAVAKKDPELAAQYRALPEAVKMRMGFDRSLRSGGDPGMPPGTGEELKRLSEARRKAMEVPAVQEARKKRTEARTSEERAKAEEDYRKVLRAAILSVDGSLAPVLEKMEAAAPKVQAAAVVPAKQAPSAASATATPGVPAK